MSDVLADWAATPVPDVAALSEPPVGAAPSGDHGVAAWMEREAGR